MSPTNQSAFRDNNALPSNDSFLAANTSVSHCRKQRCIDWLTTSHPLCY
jgi:hypothetical protein